ncbi:MAG TPA: sialidase family protein [Candidatus Paceibacterota bacterium]|nr:sialidase family protein [Candidatus Paceibacterota bacterium]HQB56858.1 sialidase family protein [Candidatus Paceibacterota bacterium]
MMKKILTTLFAFIIIISSLNFSFGEGVTGVYGWTKHISAGERWWTYIDSSADGTKLVALLDQIFYNYIYTSVDGGKTWATSTSAGEKWWSSVTSSADGTKLAATGNYRDWDISEDFNYVYTSEDSGVTWATSTSAGNRDWSSITYSSDGTKLIAAVDGGYIYI